MHYYPAVKKAIGASEKIFEYMDREPKVPTPGSLAPQNLVGHIKFQNVTFSYSDENNSVLKVRVFISYAFNVFTV